MGWLIRLAARIGPRAAKAVPILVAACAEPEVRARLIKLIGGLPGQARGLTRVERMGRRIERVRGVATDILESAAEPDVKERANGWLNRADGLRRSLAAVQALTARDQRKLRLDLIQNALDELIAEMISGGLGGPMTPDAEG